MLRDERHGLFLLSLLLLLERLQWVFFDQTRVPDEGLDAGLRLLYLRHKLFLLLALPLLDLECVFLAVSEQAREQIFTCVIAIAVIIIVVVIV